MLETTVAGGGTTAGLAGTTGEGDRATRRATEPGRGPT